MSGAALVFPGQGAQFPGMGAELIAFSQSAARVFEEASQAAGIDLVELCTKDPEGRLNLTRYTQPALFAVNVAAWRVLKEVTGLKPVAAAGHSVGEYAALCAAGVMTVRDGATAVARRAQWMEQAVPAGEGGMAAVLGTDPDVITRACREASGQGSMVSPANDNAPGQMVISGHTAALERAIELIKSGGGKVRKLRVSGPFHTELMRPAAEKMERLLAGMSFSGFSFPVIANADARRYAGPEEIPRKLSLQITSAVKWRESVLRMDSMGADAYIEAGPGKVLAGLIKRILPGACVLPVIEPGHVEAVKREVGG